MANILLFEQAATVRREFSMALIREGHRVFEAETVRDFIAHIPQADIAMIDMDLPDGEGYQAALQLRHLRPQTGVLALSAHGGSEHRIRGLRQFADQYLVKPVAVDMLSAHMAPMVRRFATGSWRLDPMRRELSGPGGHREILNDQEMRLVELLAERPNASASRRDIVTALGHNWLDYDERRLDQMVSRLRRRWRQASGIDLPLHTDRGRGYRLSVPIAMQ